MRELLALANELAPLLPGTDVSRAVDVSEYSKLLHMGTFFIHADAYRLLVGGSSAQPRSQTDAVARAKLLSLLSDAKLVMRSNEIAYFEHWQIGQHSASLQPMLYRFAVFESSHLNGNWLITESVV